MARLIIRLSDDWSEDILNSMIQAGFNQGFTEFLGSGKQLSSLSEISRCTLYSGDADFPNVLRIYSKENADEIVKSPPTVPNWGVSLDISNKKDENAAIGFAKQGANFVLCKTTDWKIIPFENLIANLSTLDTELIADVGNSLSDVELLIHTLEHGVDAIVFDPKSENDLIDAKKLLGVSHEFPITSAIIEKIISIPEAGRVCVDTSSLLHPGEGMLVGNTAKGFALVHAEVFESEFVNSRPFRVNAGEVSEYVIVPDKKEDGTWGSRTNYLSELEAGDPVFVVDKSGISRIVSIGRVKIETRPMLLFKAHILENEEKIPFHFTVQNAETVRLISSEGNSVSCTELKPGDAILAYRGPGATHFGTAIKETIIEK